MSFPVRISPLLLTWVLLAPRLATGQRSITAPLLGVRIGHPLFVAAYFGLVRGEAQPGVEGGFSGTAATAEVGAGGGELAVGRALVSPFGSIRYQATVLRTWGQTEGVQPKQTFVGAQVLIMPLHIGVGLGAYLRVTGTAPEEGHLVVINLVAGI
jgi:hypothetical protein